MKDEDDSYKNRVKEICEPIFANAVVDYQKKVNHSLKEWM